MYNRIHNRYLTQIISAIILSKKRSKLFWNFFYIIIILSFILLTAAFVYQIKSERNTYNTNEIFISYDDELLKTSESCYEIAPKEKQEVDISAMWGRVNSGDTVTLTVSSWSGELLAISCKNTVVYKKELTPIIPGMLFNIFVVFPLIFICIFLIVVINIKNPGKRILKLQKRFIG